MATVEQELKSLEIQKQLVEYKGEDRVIPAEELLAELRKDNKEKKFYNTKFDLLNGIVGGFRRGQVVIISAATGQGKTSWAQTITKHFIEQGEKCLWFSYEVGPEDFLEKMPNGIIKFWMPRQIKQNSLLWLKNRVLEGIAKYNSRIIFIDHLHYLLEMQKMAEAKSLPILIGMLLRDLKRLSIEHDVLIFLISHMKKTEMNEKPELDDLRDSSFVAQESDCVIMLWRETVKEFGETFLTNKVRVSVKKNRRTGKLGTIMMEYRDNEFFEIEEIKAQQKNYSDYYNDDRVDFKIP